MTNGIGVHENLFFFFLLTVRVRWRGDTEKDRKRTPSSLPASRITHKKKPQSQGGASDCRRVGGQSRGCVCGGEGLDNDNAGAERGRRPT